MLKNADGVACPEIDEYPNSAGYAIEDSRQVAFISMAELLQILKTREFASKSQTKYKQIINSDA